MVLVRPYLPENDETLLLRLWEGVYGPQWPLDAAWLSSVSIASTYRPGDHLIAEIGGEAAGFAMTQVGKGEAPAGSILAIGVLPEHRQRGVGKELHDSALDRLQHRGVRNVQLGSGALEYFWPGVPLDLRQAWPFFQAMGWPENERSFDLVRSLQDYRTPDWVWERVSDLYVELVTAEGINPDPVVAFVAREQAHWLDFFSGYFKCGRAREILLARRKTDGEVVGACLLDRNARLWAARFPGPLAAPGCFLTARNWQGHGIGMALVARANEILQRRGCKTAFIGWTWLVDWYGKLGFEVWQEYVMSRKETQGSNSLVSLTG